MACGIAFMKRVPTYAGECARMSSYNNNNKKEYLLSVVCQILIPQNEYCLSLLTSTTAYNTYAVVEILDNAIVVAIL